MRYGEAQSYDSVAIEYEQYLARLEGKEEQDTDEKIEYNED